MEEYREELKEEACEERRSLRISRSWRRSSRVSEEDNCWVVLVVAAADSSAAAVLLLLMLLLLLLLRFQMASMKSRYRVATLGSDPRVMPVPPPPTRMRSRRVSLSIVAGGVSELVIAKKLY